MAATPPLNALRAFEATARELSVRRAAERLNVTPSAVSHQIRALEDRLGVALFRRTGRRLFLTEAGQTLLPGLRDGFERIAAALAEVEARGRSGALTISMLSTFAAHWFIPRLPRFQKRHPDIDVRISTTMRTVAFEAGGIDAAIRYGDGRWPGLQCDRLVEEALVPVCRPALLSGGPPLNRPADLAAHTLLVAEARPDDWALWLDSAGVSALEPAGRITFDTTNFALNAAIGGAGVAIAGRELVRPDLEAGRLVQPFGHAVTRDAAYYFVCPEGRTQAPKLTALRDWLRAEAARAVDLR
jgi:LysR family glycine cleavage system transcriptional activator